jgi:type VI secretion system protein ImpM
MNAISGCGWYGKLPSAGDFIGRGSRLRIKALDLWLSEGFARARQLPGVPSEASPIWNFALPKIALDGSAMLGVLAPSEDRVGRKFALVSWLDYVQSAGNFALSERGNPFFRALGPAVASAINGESDAEILTARLLELAEEFNRFAANSPESASSVSDILDVLMPDLDECTVPLIDPLSPWPDLPARFDVAADISYWWRNPVRPGLPMAIEHHGVLNADLLLALLTAGT